MLIPKVSLVATGEEGQEPYDGTILFVEADAENVEVDGQDQAMRIGGEVETLFVPDFDDGDVEWEVEDD